MGMRLSQRLLERDLLPVYGTTEKLAKQQRFVPVGQPYTWDTNNGILVIYDERGWPWIKRGSDSLDTAELFGGEPNTRGAYVPHSNDGGEFVKKMLEEGCLSAVPSSERRAKALMLTMEGIMGLLQNMPPVRQDSEADQTIQKVWKLFELAKLIYHAKDEAGFQQALNGLSK